jgi:hypothetical protein
LISKKVIIRTPIQELIFKAMHFVNRREDILNFLVNNQKLLQTDERSLLKWYYMDALKDYDLTDSEK